MKCFLSHNSADKALAEQIGEHFLSNGIDVWLDKWEIFAGESITSKIEEGINECSAFIILMSNNSARARWVKEELRIALQRRVQDDDFIIVPVLVELCEIPGFLKDYLYIDFRDFDPEHLSRLLQSIRRVSDKPPLKTSNRLSGIHYRAVRHKLTMMGARGAETLVTEDFVGTASEATDHIDRAIQHAGSLDRVEASGFDIVRHRISPGYEKWELKAPKSLGANKDFSYHVSYRLRECFEKSSEFWIYTVEAPTESLTVEFATNEACTIESVAVYRREGQTSVLDTIQATQTETGWAWAKSRPEFKDTYEFRFSWLAENL